MKISVITINRNNAQGLKRTLESISAQKKQFGDNVVLEHIIVDGESTDDSLSQLIPALESTVISTPPRGVYDAINHGISKATGDIIGLLHSGDVFAEDDTLATIVGTFEQDPSLNYLWGDITIGKRYYKGNDFTEKALKTGYAPPHPTLYMSREAVEIVGEYDVSYRVAADFEYFIRLFKSPQLKGRYTGRCLVVMEPGGLSQKLSSRLWRNNNEKLHALRHNGIPSSLWLLMARYKNIFKGFLCSSKKK